MSNYKGELMNKGKENEEIILQWLKDDKRFTEVKDYRLIKEWQYLDVDFVAKTLNGDYILLETKSDKYISEEGNLLFENERLNHYAEDHWFYLGWGWRSKADKFIIRNPDTNEAFIFNVRKLRDFIGKFIGGLTPEATKHIIKIVKTDKQKTTFNYLIPFTKIPKEIYKKYIIQGE